MTQSQDSEPESSEVRNPFRPTFGVEPPYLAGRDHVVASVAESLDEGVGSPGRATLITGARGMGKTVLLRGIEHAAQERGWLVIAETANPGLVDRLIDHRIPQVAEHLDSGPGRRLTGVSAAGVGLSWENRPGGNRPDLRRALSDLTDLLAAHETGVLVTVDEVQGGRIEELRELGTTIQHCFGEQREVAFVGAGLPSSVSSLLSDSVLTFLRRAERHDLGPLSNSEVREALVRPLDGLGRDIDPAGLGAAVEASMGYPYLVQAIGYSSWRQRPPREVITLADVEVGVVEANDKIGQLVVAPALADISPSDRAFLAAMAVDETTSEMRLVRQRLGLSHAAVGNTRARLIEADLVVSPDRGRVDFAAPWMRRHIRDQLHVELPGEAATVLARLSAGDRKFLAAMAVDDGPSEIGAVRDRLGDVSPDWAKRFRRRLIDHGIIEPIRHGVVDFADEGLRVAIREDQFAPPGPGVDLE